MLYPCDEDAHDGGRIRVVLADQHDWLRELVFQKVRTEWEACAQSKSGPPPQRCYLREYEKCDWSRLNCEGEVLNRWLHEGDEFVVCPDDPCVDDTPTAPDSSFFQTVRVHFHIAPNGQRVALAFDLGRIHGYGKPYIVEGEGPSATLVESDGMEWVS